jgi:hypothetical protein
MAGADPSQVLLCCCCDPCNRGFKYYNLLQRVVRRTSSEGELKVYLETSVISYLTGRASRDVVTAANQGIERLCSALRLN